LIPEQIKADIRTALVKANFALHRGRLDDLRASLKAATAKAETIEAISASGQRLLEIDPN
jgi:hypothetical protein